MGTGGSRLFYLETAVRRTVREADLAGRQARLGNTTIVGLQPLVEN
jgi:hypothetical protein